MQEKIMKKRDSIIIVSLFFVCLFLHLFLGNFTKTFRVIPDEFRYFLISDSIYNGNGISLRGIDTDYQKILYSLILLPSFWIRNGLYRMSYITLINSLLMSVSIFPLAGICRKLKIEGLARYGILCLFVIWPDLLYSATFMAEVIYWPITFLFILIWLDYSSKATYKKAILLAVACYVGYMSKEIFLAYFIAVILFEIISPVFHYFSEKTAVKYDKDRMISLLIFIFVFVFVHVILKTTVFRGLGNSYDQMGIEVLFSVKHIIYMLYGFFVCIAGSMVALFVVPFCETLVNHKRMDETANGFILFLVIAFVTAQATVAYTITVREEFSRIAPRMHMRYFGPMLLCFLVLFFANRKRVERVVNKAMIVCMTIFTVFTVVIFKGLHVETAVDQQTLWWVSELQRMLGCNTSSYDDQINTMSFSFLPIVLGTVIIVVICYIILVRFKGEKIAKGYMFVILLLTCIINNVIGYSKIREYYGVDEKLYSETAHIEMSISPDDSVLYFTTVGDNSRWNVYCYDSYMTRNKNSYVSDNRALNNLASGKTDVEQLQIPTFLNLWNGVYTDIERIDYIIVDTDCDCKNRIGNVERVDNLCGEYYEVYKNINPNVLEIK